MKLLNPCMWVVILTLLLSASRVFAHEVKCDEALIGRTELYAQLVNLALKNNWLTFEQVKKATREDLQVLKLAAADSGSLPFAQSLKKVIASMTAEERESTFAYIQNLKGDLQNHEMRSQVAQHKTEKIFSPERIAFLDHGPVSTGDYPYFLIPRSSFPLLGYYNDKAVTIYDFKKPPENFKTTIHLHGVNYLYFTKPFVTPDGRLLIAYDRKVDRATQLVVREVLTNEEWVLTRDELLGSSQWVRGPNGRVFLVHGTNLKGFSVWEFNEKNSKRLFMTDDSETFEFKQLVFNSSGAVRVIAGNEANIFVFAEDGTCLAQWPALKADGIQAFVDHSGITYVKAVVGLPYKGNDLAFYKQGRRKFELIKNIFTSARAPQRTPWNEVNGHVLFTLPSTWFETPAVGRPPRIEMLEPFSRNEKAQTLAKIPGEFWISHIRWVNPTTFLKVTESEIIVYRWNEQKQDLELAHTQHLPDRPQDEIFFKDAQTGEDFVIVVTTSGLLGGWLGSTLNQFSDEPGNRALQFTDAQNQQTYFFLFNNSGIMARDISVFQLYRPAGEP